MASIATSSIAQTSELVWAGLVHEMFTIDGDEVWTVEDGGRIRHRDASGVWTFETTPDNAQNTLRNVAVYDTSTSRTHWAVGQDGRVLRKAGATGAWVEVWRQDETAPGLSGFADLWDVREVPAGGGSTNVYTLGLHGIWRADGPLIGHFTTATFHDEQGFPINPLTLELYSFDFANGYALACGEPGLIFRQHATNLDEWHQVFDIRDLCVEPNPLPKCAADAICGAQLSFEMWDLEISRNTSEHLAVAVGGIGPACGVAFSSSNQGFDWVVEHHECDCEVPGCTNCVGDPLYSKQPNNPTHVWRLREFNTLYDVGILHGDNTAIACGYGGQIVVRAAHDTDGQTPGIQAHWQDRSSYSSKPLEAPDAVTMPQHAVATNGGDGATGKAYVAGQGGFIRRSVNGGQDWVVVNEDVGETNRLPADHWRVRDVYFTDDQHGWIVNQFHVIQRTSNGGDTWLRDDSSEAAGKPYLNAITFDATAQWGVAVGPPVPGALWPTILVVDDPFAPMSAWIPPSTVLQQSTPAPSDQLSDVDWASGVEFWAVGTGGLIYHSDSTVGPTLWSQYMPDGETTTTLPELTFDGVAFSGANLGVFVGGRLIGGSNVGKAYRYDGALPANAGRWSEVAVSSTTGVIVSLTDVDFDGTTAYATGVRAIGSTLEGVVLKSTASSGTFTPFMVMGSFAGCSVGEVPNAVAVLTEVEIAPGGDVWVGGQCGRLWRSIDAGANWAPHRSASDAHVHGMSFASAASSYVGYVAGHRANRTCQSVVRVVPD